MRREEDEREKISEQMGTSVWVENEVGLCCGDERRSAGRSRSHRVRGCRQTGGCARAGVCVCVFVSSRVAHHLEVVDIALHHLVERLLRHAPRRLRGHLFWLFGCRLSVCFVFLCFVLCVNPTTASSSPPPCSLASSRRATTCRDRSFRQTVQSMCFGWKVRRDELMRSSHTWLRPT